MNTMLLKMYAKFQDLKNRDEGQDLVEYALLVALISLAAVAAIGGVANEIKTVFNSIETALTNSIG
jgi:pilus assembly protein Flp/PilA